MSAHEIKGEPVVRIEDRLLIRRFNAGDTQSLRRVYEKYKPDLLSVARALLNDSNAAEDVLHDVFVGFASQAGRFVLRGSLKGYLAVCVANRARNVNRQRSRPDQRGEARQPQSQPPDASQAAVDEEQCRAVHTAMGQLPDEQRQVIALHVLGGVRFREIAHQRGPPARRLFRQILRRSQRVLYAPVLHIG